MVSVSFLLFAYYVNVSSEEMLIILNLGKYIKILKIKYCKIILYIHRLSSCISLPSKNVTKNSLFDTRCKNVENKKKEKL